MLEYASHILLETKGSGSQACLLQIESVLVPLTRHGPARAYVRGVGSQRLYLVFADLCLRDVLFSVHDGSLHGLCALRSHRLCTWSMAYLWCILCSSHTVRPRRYRSGAMPR